MKVVLQAYWPSVVKYRWLGILLLFLGIYTVLNRAAFPFFLREVTQNLVDDSTEDLVITLCLLAVLFLFGNIMWYCFDRTITFFEARAMRDLNDRTFAVFQAQSMRFFENAYAGSLVTKARRFVNSFEAVTDAFMFQLYRTFIMVILTLIVFAIAYPWLALIFAVWATIFCTASILNAKLRMKRDLEAAEKDSAVGGAFADSLSNQGTVKSFGKEGEEQKRFAGVTEENYQYQIRAWLFGAALIRIQGVVSSSFEMATVLMMVWGWHRGDLTLSDIVFFQTYVILLIQQVWDLGNTMHKVFKSLANAKEMAEIYFEKVEVQDAVGARPLIVERGEVEFHGVNFSYVDREAREHHDVHDFMLTIPPGQTIAVVGHSGAGKSTLVKLLLRYFDLNSGYIRIDQQDVANVTQVSLRQQIAVVPQQPELFHRTLRENIAFAQPGASEEEIIAAAKRARAWDFISNLPDGLNTLVGERGVKLSGGERQRVALARAFLADAPILILDEATSALDSKTEHQIQEAIADLLVGRTCIVIAHRLSTILSADRIIVMENGSIVEEGVHQELLAQDGVYADLWNHQSGGYIED